MNYNIKGTEVPITDELRSYVERKLGGADKLLSGDSTAHTDVELAYEPVRDGAKYRAEFTLSAGGQVYRAECWGTTLHEAIDLSGGELVGELSRDKKKRLHLVRRAAVKVKEYIRGWRSDV